MCEIVVSGVFVVILNVYIVFFSVLPIFIPIPIFLGYFQLFVPNLGADE